jgi:hypothetical protein
MQLAAFYIIERSLLMKLHPLILLLTLFCVSCDSGSDIQKNLSSGDDYSVAWAYEGISDLQKGDIIVKPNLNLLPGSSFVEGGWGYGHAALLTEGSKHSPPDSLLANAMIFESHARPLHRIHQLREVPGFLISENPVMHNDNFGPQYTGGRYRLRLNLTENQIDSIIDFVRSQKGSFSSWNAMKRFPGIPYIEGLVDGGIRDNWADNTHWYCSLLVWQAVLYVTGINLDPNGGYYVFPSDLIASPHFDNRDDFIGRARF